MARRKPKTPLGRKNRQITSRRSGTEAIPRLGRRKALWRFVGALALAPLSSTALAQAPMMPPGGYAMPPAGYAMAPGAGPVVAPQAGYPPALSMSPYEGGYAPGVVPAGGWGPMVAPPPMVPQGGGGGLALPSGSVFTPRLQTSTGLGDGLGWEDGFQSFGAWLPIGLNNESMVMYLDARGFTSFDSGGGGNFTTGYRYYMPGYDRFVGVWGAYDIDAGNADNHTFHRFAVGAETVGRFLTYRVNGYIPINTGGKHVASGQVGGPFFHGNNILFLDRELTRYQYGGVEGEVGGPLPLVGKYGLSGFVGGYYLTSEVDDTVGFKGRLEANINDDLQVGAKLTTDDIFDTNVWLTITLRSPRGSLADWFRRDWLRQPSVQAQMDRAPEREYRTFTDVKQRDTTTLAIDPRDGLPYVVLHVDPNTFGGTGTFEDPIGFVANDPAYDIIYVRPGDVLTNGPIILFDNQRLLSTAVPHAFATQRGVFQLPGFTGGPLPRLQNVSQTPSAVVVLANNNEVSGFHLDGTGSTNFITGQPTFHVGILGDNITGFDINRNAFTNVTSGVEILHAGAGFGFLEGNDVFGLGFGSSSGLSVAAVDGSYLRLFINGNQVSGFYGEDSDGSGSLSPGEDFNRNNVLDPGIGVNILATRTAVIDATVTDNLITDNDTGLRLAAAQGGVVNANVSRNTINANFGTGALVEANAATMSAAFTANDISFNAGPGLHAIGAAGADITLMAGRHFPFSGNIFEGNAGAGVAMTLRTGSTGRAWIINNEIIDTVDDGTALTRFLGEGINILATDDARFVDSWIDGNLISGNASDGILIEADFLATLRNILIGNEDGNNDNGNLITNNFNGIAILRAGNARVDEIRIRDNLVLDNFAGGLLVHARGGLADVLDFVAADNTFSGNGLSGIHLDVAADGVISSFIANNRITANTLHGILTTEDRFTVDAGSITGTWTGNLISLNGGYGIFTNAATNGLIVGAIDNPNIITRNNLTGVRISNSGSANYVSNFIAQNGEGLNVGVPANEVNTYGAGVVIDGVGAKNLLFVGNAIVDNFGDGVEVTSINNGFFTFDINFTDNIVARNLGRGYDILNTGTGELLMTIRGTAPGRSIISQNAREGVYVVNTAANDQTQQGETPVGGNPNTDPTHGMSNSGAVTAQTYMTFEFVGNQVVGNGTAGVGLPGKGLVMRIGTTGGGYSPFASGGFAGDGAAGVIATVDNNFFSGNAGADFYVESFTSTGDPGSGATWSATEFNPQGYQGDPLARLDLSFVGNTFDAIHVNNLGAFYDNADGVFKSRLNTADPPGPFTQAGRRRNAQRLADRSGLPPFTGPNVPGEPFEFEYPGMGESTFRITLETFLEVGGLPFTVTGFFPEPFLIDDQPYTGFFDANGVQFDGPTTFGELPFGWSIIQ